MASNTESFLTGFFGSAADSINEKAKEKRAFDQALMMNAIQTENQLKLYDRKLEAEKVAELLKTEREKEEKRNNYTKQFKDRFPNATPSQLEAGIANLEAGGALDDIILNDDAGIKTISPADRTTVQQLTGEISAFTDQTLADYGTDMNRVLTTAMVNDTSAFNLPHVVVGQTNKAGLPDVYRTLQRTASLTKDQTRKELNQELREKSAIDIDAAKTRALADASALTNAAISPLYPREYNTASVGKLYKPDGTPNQAYAVTQIGREAAETSLDTLKQYSIKYGYGTTAASMAKELYKRGAVDKQQMMALTQLDVLNTAKQQGMQVELYVPVGKDLYRPNLDKATFEKAVQFLRSKSAPTTQQEPTTPVMPTQQGDSEPRGVRNNNPGNLRGDDKWQGKVGTDEAGFVQFDSPEAGLRALAINITNQKKLNGIETVEELIQKYAPANENDTATYIKVISEGLGVAPDAPIDFSDPGVLSRLLPLIIKHENGQQPYSQSTINTIVKSVS